MEYATSQALTLIPEDPWRSSWFASWNPDHPGGIGRDLDAHGHQALVTVVRNGAHYRAERSDVVAERIAMADAIEWLAGLEADDSHHPTIVVWSRVIRTALGAIAQGNLLPDVSPNGIDVWRCAPLSAGMERFIDSAAAALPLAGHAVPVGNGVRVVPARAAVRFCFDAVADRMVRTPAASKVTGARVYTGVEPIPVPHLRTWAQDLSIAHAAPAVVVLRMIPPAVDHEEKEQSDELEHNTWRVRFGLRGRVDPSLYLEANDLWSDVSRASTLFDAPVQRVILAGVARAASVIAPLAAAFDQGQPEELAVDDDTVEAILDHVAELAATDVDVLWPTSRETPTLRPRLVARAVGASEADGPSRFGLDALVDVDWEFLLEDSRLSTSDLTLLANAKRSLVPLRGRWVRIDASARRALQRKSLPSAARVVGAALGNAVTERELGLSDLDTPVDVEIDDSLADLLVPLTNGERADGERTIESVSDYAIDGLDATLRHYQIAGVQWLSHRLRLGVGGVLADDMGLGKTLQVIATSLHLGIATKPILVVCPTSLMSNWQREIERFAPNVDVRLYHGANRSTVGLGAPGFTITTYGVVRSDVAELSRVHWQLVVADEAQAMKNPGSATAKAIRRVRADCRLALTGTPIENRLAELWSLMDWTVPGLLGPYERFRRTIALPVERDKDPDATDLLRQTTTPFILRRVKADPLIAPDLPAKIERDVRVRLTDEQVSLYRAAADEAMRNVMGTDGITRRGRILALITSLKQIANHPAHYLDEPGPLSGRSAKLEALESIVADTMATGERVLVFTQYVAMAKLLRKHLDDRGVRTASIDGSTPAKRRQETVDAFQSGDIDVLVLSLKAAGTGLNLTAATVVIHFDRWWNPAVEDQASDRAYRIGQTKMVTVYRLISEGTIEDRVAILLDDKRELAELVLSGGDGWVSELGDDDLASFVSLTSYDVAPAGGPPSEQMELLCRS